MKILLATIGTLSLAQMPSLALANDGVMGGAGADLVPIKTADVHMVSEDIQLTFADDYWHVEADYVFRNASKDRQALQFGFPEYRCEDEDKAAPCAAAGSFRFEEMQTLVRGAPVKHRKGRVQRTHAWAPRLGTVWLFDVVVAPEETISVRHTYRVPTGYDSSGGKATRYVTRTGALWAGPIQTARFRVRVPIDAVEFIGPEPIKRTSATKLEVDGRKLVEVLYELRDFAPEDDLSFYFLPRRHVSTMNMEQPDLAPNGPAYAGLASSERCEKFVELWELGAMKAFENAKETDKRVAEVLKTGTSSRPICEATVYAKYGKRFDDERLNRYFYGLAGFVVGEWPYEFMKPNPDFDPSWLKADDLATLDLIKQLPQHDLVNATPPPAAPKPEAASAPVSTPSAPRERSSCAIVSGRAGGSSAACLLMALVALAGRRATNRRKVCEI